MQSAPHSWAESGMKLKDIVTIDIRGRRPAGRRCWRRKAAAGGAAARRSAGAPAHTATDAGAAAGRGSARQAAVCTGEPRQGLPSGVGDASPRKRAFAGVLHGSSFQRAAGPGGSGPPGTLGQWSFSFRQEYHRQDGCKIKFYNDFMLYCRIKRVTKYLAFKN